MKPGTLLSLGVSLGLASMVKGAPPRAFPVISHNISTSWNSSLDASSPESSVTSSALPSNVTLNVADSSTAPKASSLEPLLDPASLLTVSSVPATSASPEVVSPRFPSLNATGRGIRDPSTMAPHPFSSRTRHRPVFNTTMPRYTYNTTAPFLNRTSAYANKNPPDESPGCDDQAFMKPDPDPRYFMIAKFLGTLTDPVAADPSSQGPSLYEHPSFRPYTHIMQFILQFNRLVVAQEAKNLGPEPGPLDASTPSMQTLLAYLHLLQESLNFGRGAVNDVDDSVINILMEAGKAQAMAAAHNQTVPSNQTVVGSSLFTNKNGTAPNTTLKPLLDVSSHPGVILGTKIVQGPDVPSAKEGVSSLGPNLTDNNFSEQEAGSGATHAENVSSSTSNPLVENLPTSPAGVSESSSTPDSVDTASSDSSGQAAGEETVGEENKGAVTKEGERSKMDWLPAAAAILAPLAVGAGGTGIFHAINHLQAAHFSSLLGSVPPVRDLVVESLVKRYGVKPPAEGQLFKDWFDIAREAKANKIFEAGRVVNPLTDAGSDALSRTDSMIDSLTDMSSEYSDYSGYSDYSDLSDYMQSDSLSQSGEVLDSAGRLTDPATRAAEQAARIEQGLPPKHAFIKDSVPPEMLQKWVDALPGAPESLRQVMTEPADAFSQNLNYQRLESAILENLAFKHNMEPPGIDDSMSEFLDTALSESKPIGPWPKPYEHYQRLVELARVRPWSSAVGEHVKNLGHMSSGFAETPSEVLSDSFPWEGVMKPKEGVSVPEQLTNWDDILSRWTTSQRASAYSNEVASQADEVGDMLQHGLDGAADLAGVAAMGAGGSAASVALPGAMGAAPAAFGSGAGAAGQTMGTGASAAAGALPGVMGATPGAIGAGAGVASQFMGTSAKAAAGALPGVMAAAPGAIGAGVGAAGLAAGAGASVATNLAKAGTDVISGAGGFVSGIVGGLLGGSRRSGGGGGGGGGGGDKEKPHDDPRPAAHSEHNYEELRKKHGDLLKDFEKLEKEFAMLGNQHFWVEEDHGALIQEHEMLEEDFRKLEKDCAVLNTKHSWIENDREVLIKEHKVLEKDFQKLEKNFAALDKQYIWLEGDRKALVQEHTVLAEKHTALGQEHTELELDFWRQRAKHTAEITSLERAVYEAGTRCIEDMPQPDYCNPIAMVTGCMKDLFG